MAMMLLQRDATVSICHIQTRDLAQFTILADILVVGGRQTHLIMAQMVKPGAVVIDVGINRLPDGRLVGDVDFEGGEGRRSLDHAGAGRRGADDRRRCCSTTRCARPSACMGSPPRGREVPPGGARPGPGPAPAAG